MKYANRLDRLAGLGGRKWDLHFRARALAEQGREIIELTIGEPDVATPAALIDAAAQAMRAGRTAYGDGRGEPELRRALARRYAARCEREISSDQVLCFPGTQAALYAVLNAVAEQGDEILVGDPMYATYEGVIASAGAAMVPVPLDPGNGFRMRPEDLAARITPASRAILLNTPHNPTGAVLDAADIAAIGAVATAHDLWLICDEVYDELLFDGTRFESPLARAELAERTVVVSSISKSHAAPGFRSGWCVGPEAFCDRLLPLSEAILFGNQPFIADMTAQALTAPSEVAQDMRARFARRAALLARELEQGGVLKVNRPRAGMFALVDVSATGLTGDQFAAELLDRAGVAVMPGRSFGNTLTGWVRVSLTVADDVLLQACDRINRVAQAQLVGGEP